MDEKPDYSFLTGIWKTVKNGLIFFGPSIVAFLAALPVEVQTQYAPVIGAVIYFIKNYVENR